MCCAMALRMEFGANYYDERQKESIARKAVQRLKRLGYKVTIEAA